MLCVKKNCVAVKDQRSQQEDKLAKVRDEMEEKAFELDEPKVEGQVLRDRVNESEQEFREKEVEAAISREAICRRRKLQM